MSRAYEYYIHRLLEPDDKIITGTRRRYKEIKPVQPVHVVKPLPFLTEEEDNRRQDEYLKRHGIA